MTRKILFIASFCFIIVLTILLALTYYITETKKDDIEDFAIEYAINQYNIEKNNLQSNGLVNIGIEILGEYKPKLKEKLNEIDSNIVQTLATINQGDLEYLDELKALNANDRKNVLNAKSIEELTNPQFIKKYVAMKYIITLEEIPKEIRTFFLCNILLFMLIIVTTKIRNLSDRAIGIPLIMLFIATIISMYVFFFETNWLFKIIFSSYNGYGYLVLVLFIFILLNLFTLGHRLLEPPSTKEA